jgi:putative transposase
MKKGRYSEEQIVRALQEQESRQKTIVVVCKELGIAQATFHKWKQKYGGLNVNDAWRLQELESENTRLKRMVAYLMLERKPCYLRSDNGSEVLEKSLREWLFSQSSKSLFSDPGSPWQNGKCESFNGKFRDECLNAQWFRTLREAKVLIEIWQKE